MTNDMTLTVSATSRTFVKQYDNEKESKRVDISRGLTQPNELFIRQQAYVDSSTKQPGTRTNVSVDSISIRDGIRRKVSAYIVVAHPSDATDAEITEATSAILAAVNTDGFLNAAIAGEK